MRAELAQHLAGGLTTLCHAWAVTRTDAVVFGFTDHDLDLAFDGITFKADSGLSARALRTSLQVALTGPRCFAGASTGPIRHSANCNFAAPSEKCGTAGTALPPNCAA